MKIQSVQKIIKIGSNSRGVTLPTRDLKALGLETGDKVIVSCQPVKSGNDAQAELLGEYQAFKKQYASTLKNLADR